MSMMNTKCACPRCTSPTDVVWLGDPVGDSRDTVRVCTKCGHRFDRVERCKAFVWRKLRQTILTPVVTK